MKQTKKNTTKSQKKSVSLLIALILMITVGTGSTLAYIIDKPGSLINLFSPGQVSCVVEETSAVTNTGNVDEYIRVALVVNWKDADGNVYGKQPVKGNVKDDGDYYIEIDNGWILGSDGYYYYPNAVPPGTSTNAFVYPRSRATLSGYVLSIEVVAEAIQADPFANAEAAWAVTKQEGM